MSGQDSVFLRSNLNGDFKNMLSATSPLPDWAQVTRTENGRSDAKKLMKDIENLLSEVKRGGEMPEDVEQEGGKKKRGSKKGSRKGSKKQSGGKKRGSKKGSKKSSKKSSKKGSKKQSGGKKRRSSKKDEESIPKKGSKKSSKKGSKKGSKKSSKKGSKKSSKKGSKKGMKGGRGMPEAMQKILDLKKFIKTEISDLKDGAPMTSLASDIIKKNNGSLEDAKKHVKANHSEVTKMYTQIVKNMKDRREAKKAGKA